MICKRLKTSKKGSPFLHLRHATFQSIHPLNQFVVIEQRYRLPVKEHGCQNQTLPSAAELLFVIAVLR